MCTRAGSSAACEEPSKSLIWVTGPTLQESAVGEPPGEANAVTTIAKGTSLRSAAFFFAQNAKDLLISRENR